MYFAFSPLMVRHGRRTISNNPNAAGRKDLLLWRAQSSVQQNGFYLQGIHNYTTMDVFNWAATGNHTPNGCASGIVGCIYHHGRWCGAGGSGAPTDTTDAACLVHDFLYAQYGFTAGSNYNGYNPALQEINQGLCDTAGDGAISAYFGFGVASGNAGIVSWTGNPSCK
jgi:hypothetical protein